MKTLHRNTGHLSRRSISRAVCETLENRTLLAVQILSTSFGYNEFVTPTSPPHKLRVQFSADVSPSLSASDLRLDALTGESPTGITTDLVWDSATNTATFRIGGASGGILPDGNYRGSIAWEDVIGVSHEQLANDVTVDFFVLAGDADHNRSVGLMDLVALSSNWQQSPRTFSQGDFNYDGTVNVVDNGILGTNWQKVLPAAPTSPTDLSVGNQTDSTIELNWLDLAPNATGYRIQRSVDGQEFQIHQSIPRSELTFTGQNNEMVTWPDTGLTQGKRYWYRVRAYDDTSSGYDTAYTPKKSAITILAAPGIPIATAEDPYTIGVTWADQSDNETGFGIEVSMDGTTWLEAGTSTQTAFAFLEAIPNTLFYIRVYAYNDATRSAPSAYTTVLTPPSEPEGLTATEVSPTRIDLSWDALSGLTVYTLQWRRNGGGWNSIPLSGTQSTYSHQGLIESSNYEYQLAATNAAGTSEYCDIQGTYTMPQQPTGLFATVVSGTSSSDNMRIDLNWIDASNGETGYTVERLYEGTLWFPIASLGAGAQNYSVASVPGATTQQFRVTATNPATTSQPSNTATATTPSDASDYVVIETVTVPVSGTVVRSSTVLESGQHYKIRASGTISMGLLPDGNGDAEFSDFQNPQNNSPVSGVDYGIGINDAVNDASKSPSWGPYNATDHVYVVNFEGQGQTIGLNYHDDFYGDNSGSFTVQILVPKVVIRTLKPQTAEGGSEKGQFVVERTGDTAKALKVSYVISGTATQGTDFTSIPASNTVTIPAGARTALIEIEGLDDSNATETAEDVIVTLSDSGKPYRAATNNTAKVTILNRQKLLLATYGAGPTGGNSPNAVFEELTEGIAGAIGYDLLLHTENRGNQQLADFFGRLDADSDKRISKAESEAVDLKMMGYSWGAINAHNHSLKFNETQKRHAGFLLSTAIKVKHLGLIDPIVTPNKHRNGPLGANVQTSTAYHQKTTKESIVDLGSYNQGVFTKTGEESWKGVILQFEGWATDGASQDTRVDTALAGTTEIRRYLLPTSQTWGRLQGADVNHGTIVWYVYDRMMTRLVSI